MDEDFKARFEGAIFDLVFEESDIGAFLHVKVVVALLGGCDVHKCVAAVAHKPPKNHFSEPMLCAYLEYCLRHLLGTPEREIAAFLSAVRECLAKAPGKQGEVEVAAPLADPHHQRIAQQLLCVLNAEEEHLHLMHLCDMLCCTKGTRRRDEPALDPELLHLGLVFSEGFPDGQAAESKSKALYLCCSPDSLLALPLLYLLRAKLQDEKSDFALPGFSVEVLVPDLALIENREDSIFAEARRGLSAEGSATAAASFDADAELAWHPDPSCSSIKAFHKHLVRYVRWTYRDLADTAASLLSSAEIEAPCLTLSRQASGDSAPDAIASAFRDMSLPAASRAVPILISTPPTSNSGSPSGSVGASSSCDIDESTLAVFPLPGSYDNRPRADDTGRSEEDAEAEQQELRNPSLLAAQARYKIAELRAANLQGVITAFQAAADQDAAVQLPAATTPTRPPTEWQSALLEYLYTRYLQRKRRHEWWETYGRLPGEAERGRKVYSLTFKLVPRQRCAVIYADVSKATSSDLYGATR